MLRKEIVEDLKNAIARGEFKSGQRLVEAFLCKRYGVGRGRVREALRDLEHENFVKIIPNVGAIVAAMSQKEMEQIYDLMGVLEGLAVRVATPVIQQHVIRKIERLVRKMEMTTNSFRFYKYNLQFHDAITSLSNNDRLIRYVDSLRAQAMRISLQSFYYPGQINASIREHRRILEAIKKMNPLKAEKLIRDHFLQSKNRLIKYKNRSL